MIITVDTKHDSPDDIRKIIAMLRHLIGENDMVSNAPQSSGEQAAPFANLFQDVPAAESASEPSTIILEASSPQETKKTDTDDLFSDLLGEDDASKGSAEKESEGFSPSQKPKIEFY